MRLTLMRLEDTPDGVFGQLELPNGYALHTMEEDWNGNRARVSCIPAGVYRCARTIYHKHGYETFEVTQVPGRSRILFHPANTEEDVEGCIGMGIRRGTLWVHDEDQPGHPLTEKRAVVSSRQAFQRFMDSLAGVDEFELDLRWAQHLAGERQ